MPISRELVGILTSIVAALTVHQRCFYSRHPVISVGVVKVGPMLQTVEPATLKQTAGLLKSFAVGVVAFLLGVAANWLSRDVLYGAWMMLGNGVLSIFAGLIVLWYELLRTRDLRQRLIMARQTTHQVRNALQTVVLAAAAQKDEQLGTIVRNAMDRIDGVLKEVLTEPGSLAHSQHRPAA